MYKSRSRGWRLPLRREDNSPETSVLGLSSRPLGTIRSHGVDTDSTFFFGHSCAASLERPALRAAQPAGVCAACDSSFSFARQISRFGIASSDSVASRFRAGQPLKPHCLPVLHGTAEAMSHKGSTITARTLQATQTQIFDAENKRSECRGIPQKTGRLPQNAAAS